MSQSEGRYFVCDEARRAQSSGKDGERERYDDIDEARQYAMSIWESQGRKHVIVIRDESDGDEVVQTFQAEAHDTNP